MPPIRSLDIPNFSHSFSPAPSRGAEDPARYEAAAKGEKEGRARSECDRHPK